MMISQIWEKQHIESSLNDAAGTSADGQEDIKGRTCAIMDIRGLTHIGACAGTVRSAEDLRALDKPGGEFQKSYKRPVCPRSPKKNIKGLMRPPFFRSDKSDEEKMMLPPRYDKIYKEESRTEYQSHSPPPFDLSEESQDYSFMHDDHLERRTTTSNDHPERYRVANNSTCRTTASSPSPFIDVWGSSRKSSKTTEDNHCLSLSKASLEFHNQRATAEYLIQMAAKEHKAWMEKLQKTQAAKRARV